MAATEGKLQSGRRRGVLVARAARVPRGSVHPRCPCTGRDTRRASRSGAGEARGVASLRAVRVQGPCVRVRASGGGGDWERLLCPRVGGACGCWPGWAKAGWCGGDAGRLRGRPASATGLMALLGRPVDGRATRPGEEAGARAGRGRAGWRGRLGRGRGRAGWRFGLPRRSGQAGRTRASRPEVGWAGSVIWARCPFSFLISCYIIFASKSS